jgi:pullulanase-type alpha-1,6-glucosidase
MGWDPGVQGNIVFLTSGSTSISAKPRKAGAVSIDGAGAHLLSRGVLAWNVTGAASVELRASPTADITATDTDVVGGTVATTTLNAAGLDPAFLAKNPQFKGYARYDLAAADQATIPAALQGQLVAVARKADGSVLAATQVQRALAIDDVYAYAGPLGVSFATVAGTPTFELWAPTAQSVKLHVHEADAARTEIAGSPFTMARGAAGTASAGVWSHVGAAAWYGKLYRFELVVYHPTTGRIETLFSTDPYAVSLSTNGTFAQIVDLADPSLKPAGWDALAKPPLAAPEDVVVYESHVRDFSALDPTTPAERRGKYLGFVTPPAGTPSDGLDHLAALASAGLTHVHLLPAFDFATVDEDPAHRVDLSSPFEALCALNAAVPAATCTAYAGKTILEAIESQPGDSAAQQQIADWMHLYDAFNWGYDPLHYGAPEGSYASTAEGPAKILEFRQMVQGLAAVGLRVVMDVVYNHTNAAGITDKAVLDKLVPGYYHRLTLDGGVVESSSCCANTATEHVMMGRLMTDTMVRWARDYKVDGFRWDLMGLHKKDDVLRTQAALAALTPAADGVDGSKLYLYGEGWDMGELGAYKQGIAATQINMSGTGIGTFNDRIRDATRGGSAFDSLWDLRKNQGFATGLTYAPNELAVAPSDAQKSYVDWIKIGMAGNLRDFRLIDVNGVALSGMDVGYNGVRAGYTQDPQEAVNYVSAHDNQVLFDIVQAKLATGTPMADRVRAVEVALDVVALGQGVPFFHMGDDLLRSKSMERDSYDSGDWFNRVSWTGAGIAGWSGPPNGWKSGLPNASKDQANWPLVTQLFADATIAPTTADVTAAATHFQEVLAVRKSSRLFRLTTGADVMKRVDFLTTGPSQPPGLIVMTITDGTCAGADLDPAWDAVVVVINADVAAHDWLVANTSGFQLHPTLAGSADPVVRTAAVTTVTGGQSFHVPARTSAVFVQPQGASQGPGLPCNTR